MKRVSAVFCLGLLVIAVCLSGCFPAKEKDIEAFVKPHQVDVTAPNYILQPADEIMVISSQIPEFSAGTAAGSPASPEAAVAVTPGISTAAAGVTQRIRPDGKISFPNFGEILAAGKTPSQLAEELRKKGGTLYNLTGNYPIDVRISVSKSKVYYVIGEVDYPGPKVYTGRDNALTALTQSKPGITAWKEKIEVIRPSNDPNVTAKIFHLRFDRMINKGDTTTNVLLQEGDIIYVPPTILAAMGNVIAEFVRPIGTALSPAASAYSLSQIGSN
jgi:polysaccharide biosynthesis/export protein